MFGSQDKMIRIDMSEYMEKFNVSRLLGAAPGYVGYEEGGQLTEAVRRNPYSVVLLDEIEKAHPEVFNVLLQVMDEGRLTDAQGRETNFRNTVIIMTSNAGSEEQNKAIVGFSPSKDQDVISYEKMKERLTSALKNVFRPEFLNRIDEIIMFHSLTKKEVREIIVLMLDKLNKQLTQQRITATYTDVLIDYLMDIGYDQNYGARPLRRAIQKNVENKISEAIIAGTIAEGDTITVDLGADKKIKIKKQTLVNK